MRITMCIVLGIAALASLAAAEPIVTWVTTETVYAGGDYPESRVVQGSVFRVYPRDLLVGEQSALGFPLPMSLAGTSVRVMAGGGIFDALLLSTDRFSVRALLPSKIPPGDALLILTNNGQESSPFKIRVVRRDFGLYDVAQNFDEAGHVEQNTFEHPAKPGQLVGLWGTGLGPVDGDEASGPLPSALTIPGLEVLVGGVPAKVVYTGRSGCCAGVDQIIVEVPRGVLGCNIAAKVRYPDGDAADAPKTNFGAVSLVVAESPGGCSSFARTLRYGQISVSSAPYGSYASFYNGGPDVLPPMGTCGLSRVTRLPYLDAGSAIHLATPEGRITLVPAPGLPRDAYYSQFGQALPAGDYAVDNGNGGRDLGPFRATFSLPEVGFSWTNQDRLNVHPDEGLRISWKGGVTGGYVVIWGAFSVEGYDGGTDRQGGFFCVERVEKGTFLVPAADMWTSLTRAADYLLELEVIHVYKQMIDVPGLDLTEFFYNLGAHKAVKLR
jgi:uncharacterized protein (TIGR03437 family)